MKVGILMNDYKLEYEVEKELKELGRRFTILSKADDIKDFDVVLSDYLKCENCIVCKGPKECTRRLQSYFYGKKKFMKIVVGIDPGPKPGIAVIGDGAVIEEIQLSSVSRIGEVIDAIYLGYSPEFFLVRVGDGDITNRNMIINSLVEKYAIELVNEKNTSESIINKDVESAKVIAFTRGRRVREKLNIVVKEGYIRDIQRKSRIESNGNITISKALAKKVALGEISLEEAIERMRDGKNESRRRT